MTTTTVKVRENQKQNKKFLMPRAARKLDGNFCFPLITHTPRMRAMGDAKGEVHQTYTQKTCLCMSYFTNCRQFQRTTSLKSFYTDFKIGFQTRFDLLVARKKEGR